MEDHILERLAHVIEPGNAERAVETITLAFADDPPSRWLFPEADTYARSFAAFATAFGGGAVADGTGLEVEDLAGVALWMAPGVMPDEEALLGVIEKCVPAKRHARVQKLLAEMGRQHPAEPHWYLPLIGVDPARQGQGLGTALMRPGLRAADAMGLPVYLEATSPRNVRFYRRLGFRAIGEIRVGDCPPITAMKRYPRPR